VAGASSVEISCAVEGLLDEAILIRIIEGVGARVGTEYNRGQGKHSILKKLKGYNNAAKYAPWCVLIDLNTKYECAPLLREEKLRNPSRLMCFRIAVREVESWLLADRERLAAFLHIDQNLIAGNPEALDDPKQTMVNLARRSPDREIREDMVPRPGSGRKVGPAYSSRLTEFVSETRSGWRPSVAARRSDSLKRCLKALKELSKATAESDRKRK